MATKYGDPVAGAWDASDDSNRRDDFVGSNWDLADRPAKPLHESGFATILSGLVDIIADGPEQRGGKREPAPTDRVTALRALPYGEYLKTEEWRATREAKVADAGTSCQRCGLKYRKLKKNGRLPLHVHHLTYVRLGAELLTDLAVVCRLCHRQLHNPGEADQGEAV